MVFENKVLRGILRPYRDEIIEAAQNYICEAPQFLFLTK
jgi:hypothetical protein